jgi:curli biogenesis system outer membrane secretion channel CsgG
MVDRIVMPKFDHTFIDRIAVLEFTNRTANPYAGKVVANAVEEVLVNKSHYSVVPRQMLKGYDPRRTTRIGSALARQIGEASGVDALVLGSVETYEYEEKKTRARLGERLIHGGSGPKMRRTASVLVYVKLVDTRTGRAVWCKSAGGNVKWTGWPAKRSTRGANDYLKEALDEALVEVRTLFPHKEKVRELVKR